MAAPAMDKRPNKKLKGIQKASVMILSLDEDKAAKVLGLLDDDEIRQISQNMATLGTIEAETVESLCLEFAGQISSITSITGTFENTERLLAKALGKDRVDIIMEEIRGPAGKTMWDKLANVNEHVLANYLKNEYPQTVAVILSKIRADHSARVLSILPDTFAMEVVMRMLRMETVQKDIIDDIEQTLKIEFMSNLARTSRRDPHEAMADIFNGFDRNTESRFLAALEERNRDAAEKIKSLMFTFEDLVKLDQQSVQTVLRMVDKDKLALGLKGASDKLKELFFSNMSERAGKIMKEDMAAMGPVRLRDVDEAQTIIVNKVKELAESGQVVINEGKEDDELIE